MAVQGNGEPGWLAEIRNHHLPRMRPELKRGLIALAQGRSRQDIAAQEGVEPATIKRWIETATAEIASSLSEDRGSFGELRGAWVILHQHCCLEAEMEASA